MQYVSCNMYHAVCIMQNVIKKTMGNIIAQYRPAIKWRKVLVFLKYEQIKEGSSYIILKETNWYGKVIANSIRARHCFDSQPVFSPENNYYPTTFEKERSTCLIKLQTSFLLSYVSKIMERVFQKKFQTNLFYRYQTGYFTVI